MSEYTNIEIVHKIAAAADELGGAVYYVGGCVRDKIMGSSRNKDIDIEVHNISQEQLERILDSIGNRIEIGKCFGVYNLGGADVDIAMPRKERKTGLGHREFDVTVDPYIGTKKAAERRDFTMNSLMENVITGELIDHFGGVSDIKNKVIRHINEKTFIEDPLRVFRGAQFAARFEFEIADETIGLCSKMELSALPKERVFEELKKALLTAYRPSIFFNHLRKMDKLDEWFIEVKHLIGAEQNKRYHKEGDVYTHTMMVLDKAARLRGNVENKIGFMLAALVHDFGKPGCSEMLDGIIHSYRHEEKGLTIIDEFMHRITGDKSLISFVLNLSKLHMKPNTMASDNSSIKATNKMFDESVDPIALVYLAQSDKGGQINDEPYFDTLPYLKERLKIYEEYMKRPYVTGKDLIDAGFGPDESFSAMLELAHKLRLSGVDKKSALGQIIGMYKNKL